jgi:hypothetical protein
MTILALIRIHTIFQDELIEVVFELGNEVVQVRE